MRSWVQSPVKPVVAFFFFASCEAITINFFYSSICCWWWRNAAVLRLAFCANRVPISPSRVSDPITPKEIELYVGTVFKPPHHNTCYCNSHLNI
ncbi:uncharacterized protein LY89DRAFT_431042 [Mollisia scopiformis]|uniref:Uncharacterized protein n=1 Tax=Mollisia scopiformis TaxID=149040 RepID=A0A194XMB1_MOLSC|nr:uncharacterized protein LY89DRAFT_431042 [Mollisia scopiformis]KUJ21261.1 hypothetical protein LY89DRAFT_431042 [Mollisia scopiformis]